MDKILQPSVLDKSISLNFKKLTLQDGNHGDPSKAEREVPATTRDESGDTSNEESSDDDPQTTYHKNLPTTIVDENKLVECRVKLYRFDNELKQWKETGIGKIMILQSEVNMAKCRVVMWAEATGRVACNFSLFPELHITSYQQNSKILCWKAFDFADSQEPQWETFTCKFASEKECNDFKTMMLQYAKKPSPPPIHSPTNNNKSDCSGCVGCDPDNYEFRPVSMISQHNKEPIIEIPLVPESCNDLPPLVKTSMFI